MKKGDLAYIIVSGFRIEEVKITNVAGNLYTVKFSTGGGIRLPRGRLYPTKEAAEAQLPKKLPHYKTPYDI